MKLPKPVISLKRVFAVAVITALTLSLQGCDDPQVYGSVGISSGYGSHGGWGPHVNTSISIGGRIR